MAEPAIGPESNPADPSAEKILIDAFKAGRPIVPFLGAGVSINTGFPPIGEIAAYLAKVRHYIDFMRPVPGAGRRPEPGRQGAYSEYLREYGWPDFNELNANLCRYTSSKSPGREVSGQEALANVCSILRHIRRDGSFEAALKVRWATRCSFRPQQVVDAEHLRMVSEKDWGLASRMIDELLTAGKYHEMRLRGDWYDLMMTLSEGDFDLVDSLFTALGKGKRHGSAHVLLSKLVGALGVNLFLTLNFDPFLESAFAAEGHNPKVVDTSRDADLPSPLVVSDELSIVKLHGSAYGLRIGEKIQVSLDSETRNRALDLIPRDALILVMGFSGAERRMSQLLEDVALRGKARSQSILWMHWLERPDYPLQRLIESIGQGDIRVAPRRYSSVDGFLLRILCSLKAEYPSTRSTYRALPTRCVVCAPAPAPEPKAEDGRIAEARAAALGAAANPLGCDIFGHPERIRPFFGQRLLDVPEPMDMGMIYDPTLDMGRFASALEEKGYRTIWIDCEEHHTAEGVVDDVIDQIRTLDPLFPPYLMRTGESLGQDWDGPEIAAKIKGRNQIDQKQFERAVERIREALQRGRYVLCIDSPETIARPQTVHHSLPSFLPADRPEDGKLTMNRSNKFRHRIERFFRFLKILLLEELEPGAPGPIEVGESYIAIAMCLPDRRHRTRKSDNNEVIFNCCLNCVEALKGALVDPGHRGLVFIDEVPMPPGPEVWVKLPERRPSIDFAKILRALIMKDQVLKLEADTVRVFLSVFRRPRSYLGVRSLLTQAGELVVELPYRGASAPGTTGGGSPGTGIDQGGVPSKKGSLLDAREFLEIFGVEEGKNPAGGERLTAEGLIWLNRRVRGDAYLTLSDPPRAWFDAIWKARATGPGRKPNPEVVQCLIILSILHRRASRYYFSEVYAASHDLDAFREYIYHRIAYLRFMARLTFVARHYEAETRRAMDDLKGIDKEFFRHLGLPPHTRPPAELSHGLMICRLGELQAFRAALSRESATILRSLNANTWISWLERLISEECQWIQEEGFLEKAIGPTQASKPSGARRAGRGPGGLSKAESSIKSLFDVEIGLLEDNLRVQEIQLLAEKADWVNALQALTTVAVATIAFIGEEEVRLLLWPVHFSFEEDFTGRLVELALNYKENRGNEGWRIAWGEFKRVILSWPEEESPRPWVVDPDRAAEAIRRCLKPTASTTRGKVSPPTYVDWHLRALSLIANLLQASSFAHHLAIAEVVGADDSKGPREAEADDSKGPRKTEKVLLQVAGRMLDGIAWAQGVITGLPTRDGTPFFSSSIIRVLRLKLEEVRLEHALRSAISSFGQYSPWFDQEPRRLLKEGCRLLDASDDTESGRQNKNFLIKAREAADILHEQARQIVFENRSEYNRIRSLAWMFRARSDYLAGIKVESALSWLDKASTLLEAEAGAAPPIERISILRCRIECLMLDADAKLAERSRRASEGDRWQAWESAWSASERRLMQARKSLDEASRIYRERGRNVAWWLRLSRDFTQWCIEASVANICGDPIWRSRRNVDRTRVTRIEETFDLGVSAIRAGLNALSWTASTDEVDEIEKSATEAELLRSSDQWLRLMACVWFRTLIDDRSSEGEFRFSTKFDDFWKRWKTLNENHLLPRLVSDSMKDPIKAQLHSMTGLGLVMLGARTFRKRTDQVTRRGRDGIEFSFDPRDMDLDFWMSARTNLLECAASLNRCKEIRDVIRKMFKFDGASAS